MASTLPGLVVATISFALSACDAKPANVNVSEASTPITTGPSFNAESFAFRADLLLQLSFLVKDFKEEDTSLEYIGKRNHQGDGGFIAQFRGIDSGQLSAASNSQWQRMVAHRAPLSRVCEESEDLVPGVHHVASTRSHGQLAGVTSITTVTTGRQRLNTAKTRSTPNMATTKWIGMPRQS